MIKLLLEVEANHMLVSETEKEVLVEKIKSNSTSYFL